MTDITDFTDVKILDFGLSKILAPGEMFNEQIGTLVKIINIKYYSVI